MWRVNYKNAIMQVPIHLSSLSVPSNIAYKYSGRQTEVQWYNDCYGMGRFLSKGTLP